MSASTNTTGYVSTRPPLSTELDRYLAVRRNLGYSLTTEERILRRFVAFAAEAGEDVVSVELFLRWRASWPGASTATWAARLGTIRSFAAWLSGLDPAHQVPPKGLIPSRIVRPAPYIYAPSEIAAIVAAAAELGSDLGLRGRTFSTLFGVIAATGLRLSEALKLDMTDYDRGEAVLTIREGKWGKSRLVPLAPDVAARLNAYCAERDRVIGRASVAMFVNERGKRIGDCSARYNFAHASQTAGVRSPTRYGRHGKGPRIHDLRHTFAVRTMIGWYETGLDPAREMVKLTTCLGHGSPDATYWYIEAVPELMRLAAERSRCCVIGRPEQVTIPLPTSRRRARRVGR